MSSAGIIAPTARAAHGLVMVGRCVPVWRVAAIAVYCAPTTSKRIRENAHARRTDQEHWHEPKAGENAGLGKFLRKPMPYDGFMEAEGVPGLSQHRCPPRAGLADAAMEAARRARHATSSSTAPKGCGACTWSRCRAPARSRSSTISTRSRCWWWKAAARPRSGRKARRRSRPSSGRRARCSRSRSTAWHRFVNATSRRAAAVRHLGAQHHQPRRQPQLRLQLPVQFRRALFRRRRLLQAEGRHRARSRARARHAAHQLHPRHHRLRAAARQPPLARLPPRRAAHGRATASISGSASTRPAATPRRTSTPRPPC